MTRAHAIGRTLTNASLQSLGKVFAFGDGVWLFGGPVQPMAPLGMALIVAAGLGSTLRRRRGNRRQA